MDPSMKRILKIKKYIYINAHTPVEKQSKEDWIK